VSALLYVALDFSERMIEWMELAKLQGYSKAFVYVYAVIEGHEGP